MYRSHVHVDQLFIYRELDGKLDWLKIKYHATIVPFISVFPIVFPIIALSVACE
jgi:hypothetical protein